MERIELINDDKIKQECCSDNEDATLEGFKMCTDIYKLDEKQEIVEEEGTYLFDSAISTANDMKKEAEEACSSIDIKEEPCTNDPLTYSGAFKEISYSREEIFQIIKSVLRDNHLAYDMLQADVSQKMENAYIFSKEEKQALSKLLSEFRRKWQVASRKEEFFLKKFQQWLSVPVSYTIGTRTEDNSTAGRPSTSWDNLSDRSKRRKTQYLRAEHSVDELAYATQMSLRSSGQMDASTVIKDITESSPSKAKSYRKSAEYVRPGVLSSNEALSILVEAKLSKSKYNLLRSAGLEKNNQLFPAYKKVLESKNKCYPEKSEITVTESGASVTLQALLNHTVERILLTKCDVIKSMSECEFDKLQLICLWGCDGTSGQSMYKQKFQNDNLTDASIFFISLVPLQVSCTVNPEIIIWKNPRPSSTRFCRPIKIQFLHETAEATRKEVASIKAQQETLKPYSTVFEGKKITVDFQLSMTMVDGKVINSVTETSSSMRCYLCQATSKEFNDIDKMLQKPINADNLQFGISSLHAWIRFFECCLHLSYKIELKKWQSRKEDKEIVESRKKIIQEGFRVKLGLKVDCPKQGYGSTNDGNTARRFFENYEISASITGVDEDLIKRFYIILQVISCGFEINVEEFQKYTENTARKFVELYPWYFMPTTIHKILLHGHKIIESLLLPIGQMSEEAQELCNKFIKRYRDFARKCDRVKNMEDVFHRLLVSSDPLISNLRKLPAKKLKSLSRQAQDLLVPVSQEQSFHDVLLNVTSDSEDCSDSD